MKVAASAILLTLVLIAGCAAPPPPASSSNGPSGSGSVTSPPSSQAQTASSSSTAPGTPLPAPFSAASAALVAANTEFAVDLLREVTRSEPGKNIFTSPFSVSTALAMAYDGADGATRDAMRTTLGFADMDQATFDAQYRALLMAVFAPQAGVLLEVGNSMWIEDGFEAQVRQQYVDAMRQAFLADVEVRDFLDAATLDDINGWASEKTHGKVPKVLEEIDPAEVMFLLNAVYFKGDWAAPFNATCTHKAAFTRTDGSQVQADMMCGQDLSNVTYYVDADVRAARLPYAGHGVAMYVLLPEGGTALATLLAKLSGDTLDATLDKVTERGADPVTIPKFKLKTHLDLKAPLTSLGMGVAFTPYAADFPGIADTGPERLFLSRVLHDAVVEVDEKGTVAAAVTTVGVGVTSLPPSVVADRPFLVVMRHEETGSILFFGAVEDPTAQ